MPASIDSSGSPPAPRVRRRLSAPARRAQILSAAAGCFAAAGYEGTAMDDIALAAGVTKPVVYDHFPSKEALYLALLTGLSDRLLEEGRAVAGPDVRNREAVAAAVAVVVHFMAETPAEAVLLFQPPSGEGRLAMAVRAIQDRASVGMAALLASRAPGSAAWQQRFGAEFVKAGLHAAMLWWRDHPELDRATLTAELDALVWSGVGGAFALAQPTPDD
jgi:AcrR family transcriptional regulator